MHKLASEGDAKAQYSLAACFFHGWGLVKDEAQSARWWRLAAEQGYAPAQYSLGFCYINGIGMANDAARAAEWFLKAAGNGNAKAQYRLGLCHANGEGVPRDLKEAAHWYLKAADQGHDWAQYNIGRIYFEGLGRPKDLAEAIGWYRKAAAQQNIAALCGLGECYATANGAPKNLVTACDYWTQAARLGDAPSQYFLGLCFVRGEGVNKDDVEAVAYLSLSCATYDQSGVDSSDVRSFLTSFERDLPSETRTLGQARANTLKKEIEEGVQSLNELRDAKLIAELHEGAGAKYGLEGEVMYYVGGVYYKNKDTNEAIKYWRKAADCGHTLAQYNLGKVYMQLGRVCGDFMVEAWAWLSIAASKGHEGAQKGVTIAEAQMAAYQFMEARERLTSLSNEILAKSMET